MHSNQHFSYRFYFNEFTNYNCQFVNLFASKLRIMLKMMAKSRRVVDHFAELDYRLSYMYFHYSKHMIIQLQEFLSERVYRVRKLFRKKKKPHNSQLFRTRRSSILASGHQKHYKAKSLEICRAIRDASKEARNCTLPTSKQRCRKVNFLGNLQSYTSQVP